MSVVKAGSVRKVEVCGGVLKGGEAIPFELGEVQLTSGDYFNTELQHIMSNK